MLFLLLAAVCCAADQLLKRWIVDNIVLGGTRELIPGVVGLTHVRNTGMAFSLFSEHTWVLALISAVAAAALVWLILREKVMLALILGGAVGNLLDRAFLGYVVDMFQTLFVEFAVFNLADALIDVGAAVFCVLYIVRTVREDREKKASGEAGHESDADGR